MKRKYLLSAFVLALMLSTWGCGAETSDMQNDEIIEQTEEVQENEDEPEMVADETEEESATSDVQNVEEIAEVETVTYTEEELEAMSSVEFAKILKAGWNLGNTLDAENSGLDAETSWGMPKTTPEIIHFIKEVGFTSIRIPVSWGKHTDDEYNIDSEWMARVKEVVDYAYDEGLFVIINSHHDVDYYYPSPDHYAESEKYLTTIWAQIAEEFIQKNP